MMWFYENTRFKYQKLKKRVQESKNSKFIVFGKKKKNFIKKYSVAFVFITELYKCMTAKTYKSKCVAFRLFL